MATDKDFKVKHGLVVSEGITLGSVIETSSTQDLILRTNAGTNSGAITITDGANGAINVAPHGNGNVHLGTLVFDADQDTASSNNHVLTFDSTSGLISLEAAASGGASAIGSLDDVLMDATDFVDGFLLQPSSNTSAPSHGTLSSATGNTGIGKDTYAALTSGTYNTSVGYVAGKNLIDGANNVMFGKAAGQEVTSGSSNTAVGTNAGLNIDSGSTNIAIGSGAGDNITSGSNNVMIGGADAASATADSQLSISDGDGGTVWITGVDTGGGSVRVLYPTSLNSYAFQVASNGNNANPFSSTVKTTATNAVQTSGHFTSGITSGTRTTGFGTQLEFRIGEANYGGYIAGKIGAKMKDTGNSNFDMFITPSGTGNVELGNFIFDADQSVGSGQDNYVLTYDHANTKIALEAAGGSTTGYTWTSTSGSEQFLISDTSDTTLFKVVQLGTGNAFEVHDQATDNSAFFANNAGKVGILKNPSSSLIYDVEIGGETLSERFTSSVSGSVGSPAFRFSSDSNNGMYLGGTDILGFSTAGTERMTISAAGVVNIAGSLTVAGSAVGGASVIGGLTDVSMDIANFTDGFLLQTDSDGSAPTTGTLDSALRNIGIGGNVFAALTSGDDNFAFGSQALESLTSGHRNIAIGQEALGDITTESDNIAIGNGALRRHTTGTDNIAIGYLALATTTSQAKRNVAIGTTSMYALTEGDENVAVGRYSLREVSTGSDNTAVGTSAGQNITTGEKNTLIGMKTGDGFDAENHNIAIGFEALSGAVAGGEYNVAIGNYAGDAVTSADGSVLMGHNAGTAVTTGNYNTLLGYEAGAQISSGYGNIAIGRQANRYGNGNDNLAFGFSSLSNPDLVGERNIAIGYSSGDNITSGDDNVVIGSVDVASITGNKQLSISSNSSSSPVTWITGDSDGNVKLNQLADVVAVSSNTQLTTAQTGSYVYWTAGTCTLPVSATVGQQFTIFNNTGSSATVGLGSGNTMATNWANGGNTSTAVATADNDATSFVCVASTDWVQVGA